MTSLVGGIVRMGSNAIQHHAVWHPRDYPGFRGDGAESAYAA